MYIISAIYIRCNKITKVFDGKVDQIKPTFLPFVWTFIEKIKLFSGKEGVCLVRDVCCMNVMRWEWQWVRTMLLIWLYYILDATCHDMHVCLPGLVWSGLVGSRKNEGGGMGMSCCLPPADNIKLCTYSCMIPILEEMRKEPNWENREIWNGGMCAVFIFHFAFLYNSLHSNPQPG